jgi:hypothetical protein
MVDESFLSNPGGFLCDTPSYLRCTGSTKFESLRGPGYEYIACEVCVMFLRVCKPKIPSRQWGPLSFSFLMFLMIIKRFPSHATDNRM